MRIGAVESTWLSFDGRWAVISRGDPHLPDRELPAFVIDLEEARPQTRVVQSATGFAALTRDNCGVAGRVCDLRPLVSTNGAQWGRMCGFLTPSWRTP